MITMLLWMTNNNNNIRICILLYGYEKLRKVRGEESLKRGERKKGLKGGEGG